MDDTVGYCRLCGQPVIQKLNPGYRSYMSRFAEPDDVVLRCTGGCGKLDEDQIADDQDEALDAIEREERRGPKEPTGS